MILSKKNKKLWRRSFKDNRCFSDRLQNRLDLKNHITQSTEDGKIALLFDSIDCDAVKMSSTHHVNKMTVMAFILKRNQMYEWAEGPSYLEIGKPSDNEEYSTQRDLALEAYENGHPYSIRM